MIFRFWGFDVGGARLWYRNSILNRLRSPGQRPTAFPSTNFIVVTACTLSAADLSELLHAFYPCSDYVERTMGYGTTGQTGEWWEICTSLKTDPQIEISRASSQHAAALPHSNKVHSTVVVRHCSFVPYFEALCDLIAAVTSSPMVSSFHPCFCGSCKVGRQLNLIGAAAALKSLESLLHLHRGGVSSRGRSQNSPISNSCRCVHRDRNCDAFRWHLLHGGGTFGQIAHDATKARKM